MTSTVDRSELINKVAPVVEAVDPMVDGVASEAEQVARFEGMSTDEVASTLVNEATSEKEKFIETGASNGPRREVLLVELDAETTAQHPGAVDLFWQKMREEHPDNSIVRAANEFTDDWGHGVDGRGNPYRVRVAIFSQLTRAGYLTERMTEFKNPETGEARKAYRLTIEHAR